MSYIWWIPKGDKFRAIQGPPIIGAEDDKVVVEVVKKGRPHSRFLATIRQGAIVQEKGVTVEDVTRVTVRVDYLERDMGIIWKGYEGRHTRFSDRSPDFNASCHLEGYTRSKGSVYTDLPPNFFFFGTNGSVPPLDEHTLDVVVEAALWAKGYPQMHDVRSIVERRCIMLEAITMIGVAMRYERDLDDADELTDFYEISRIFMGGDCEDKTKEVILFWRQMKAAVHKKAAGTYFREWKDIVTTYDVVVGVCSIASGKISNHVVAIAWPKKRSPEAAISPLEATAAVEAMPFGDTPEKRKRWTSAQGRYAWPNFRIIFYQFFTNVLWADGRIENVLHKGLIGAPAKVFLQGKAEMQCIYSPSPQTWEIATKALTYEPPYPALTDVSFTPRKTTLPKSSYGQRRVKLTTEARADAVFSVVIGANTTDLYLEKI